MTFRSQAGQFRRQMLSRFYQRLVPLVTRDPIVTFTFDDFPRTALTAGAEILECFGARATYYVAMSLMGTTNDLGEQFRREDLVTLLGRGHEIASHTFSHSSARRVHRDALERDVEKGIQAIKENLGVDASGNFAYPYGEATLTAKRRLGQRLLSCRGTIGGLNGPHVDLNLLRANSLYGGVERVNLAKQSILDNEEQRRWLIFYTHDVVAKPSPFGCTPQLLERVCSFAAAHGARFMTVAQVMEELGQGQALTHPDKFLVTAKGDA